MFQAEFRKNRECQVLRAKVLINRWVRYPKTSLIARFGRAAMVSQPPLHFSQADGCFIPALRDHGQIVKVLKYSLIVRHGENHASTIASFVHNELFPMRAHVQFQRKRFSFLLYIRLAG